jgi:hypothetical protein
MSAQKMNKNLLCAALMIVQLFWCEIGLGEDKNIHEKLRSSCPEAVFFFSEPELREIARNESKKRGGEFSDDWKIKIFVEHCNYEIFVNMVPARPGGHFVDYVSGITGKVIKHYGGR